MDVIGRELGLDWEELADCAVRSETPAQASCRTVPAVRIPILLGRHGLEKPLDETVDAGVTQFVWLRKFDPGSNSAAANRLLDQLVQERSVPEAIVTENGSELRAAAVRDWLGRLHVGPLFILPSSPWENGYGDSFNGKLRDELLDGEIFYTPKEAQVFIEQWRQHYNRMRPHSSLGYRPPAPAAAVLRSASATPCQ